MKDAEFIELLNLYLDHEISPGDAPRLEAEVMRNPARRRIYEDYCRMQKACTLLSADFTAQSPAAVALEPARRDWAPNIFAIGGLLAAAACVAFVFTSRSNESQVAPQGSGIVNKTAPVAAEKFAAAPALDARRSIPETVTVRPKRNEFQLVVATQDRMGDDSLAVDSTHDERFDWMNKMQLSSLPQVPSDTLRFETKRAIKAGPTTFGSGLQAPVESVSWQFQR